MTTPRDISKSKADVYFEQLVTRWRTDSDDGLWNKYRVIANIASDIEESCPERQNAGAEKVKVPWYMIRTLRRVFAASQDVFVKEGDRGD